MVCCDYESLLQKVKTNISSICRSSLYRGDRSSRFSSPCFPCLLRSALDSRRSVVHDRFDRCRAVKLVVLISARDAPWLGSRTCHLTCRSWCTLHLSRTTGCGQLLSSSHSFDRPDHFEERIRRRRDDCQREESCTFRTLASSGWEGLMIIIEGYTHLPLVKSRNQSSTNGCIESSSEEFYFSVHQSPRRRFLFARRERTEIISFHLHPSIQSFDDDRSYFSSPSWIHPCAVRLRMQTVPK